MIALGIVLFVLGMLLFLASLRGRVVSRGQFCRSCKFDLAGLDLASTQAKCPECGSEVHQESARRTLLRRRSRLGLAAATLLLIGSITTLGVWSSGNASVILGVMPDSIVLQLADMSMDAALDELVIRVSRVPNPMTADQIDRSIKIGLEHQADLLVGFDPRWGEVLSIACIRGKMTTEQLKQYMLYGLSADVLIRDRVRQGAEKIDALMRFSPSRLQALNNADTGYVVQARWIADGVVDKPARLTKDSHGFVAIVSIPGIGFWNNSGPYPIVPTADALNGDIGTMLSVYTEFDLVLSAAPESMIEAFNAPVQHLEEDLVLGRFRVDHEVKIIHPDEPIVPLIDDPELAELAYDAIMVLPVRVVENLPAAQPKNRMLVLSMSTQTLNLPETIAFRVFLRFDDEELEIENWVTNGPHSGTHMSGLQWGINPNEPGQFEYADELTKRLIERGHVDVILRTDADLAQYMPEIKQVLDLTMIFKDVPTQPATNVSTMSSSSADKRIKGKLFKEEPNLSDSVQSP